MRHILFIFILLLSVTASYSQITSDSLQRRVKTGFSYHLQLNHFDFSPSLLLIPSEKMEVGLGVNYLYYYRMNQWKGKSSFGFHTFARYFPYEKIFLQGEYLLMQVPYRKHLDYTYTKVSVATMLIGGGYRQPFTEKLNGYLYFLVDLHRIDLSAYNSKILIKAGISF